LLRDPGRLLPVAGAVAFVLAVPQAALAQGFGGTVADHLVRGDSLLAQGRNSEAVVQFQEARTLCPNPAEIVASLQGEARALIGQRELLPAAGLLEEAAGRFPDDPRVPDLLYTAAMTRQQSGQVAKAVDLMRKALAKSPTPDVLPMIKFQLARSLRLGGEAAEAVEVLKDFETAFPKSPLLPNALYTLASAEHDLGQLDPAEAQYRAVIERYKGTPAATEAHFELATVLTERGKRGEAAEFYRKFVALNPGSEVAARALERAGDMRLFKAPRESAELYALAAVKAAANPKPAAPDLMVSRWLETKKRAADLMSRGWIIGVGVAGALGALALAGLWLVRRRRAPHPVGA